MKKRAKICFYIFVICAFCALGILGYFVFNDNGDNVMVGSRKFVTFNEVPCATSYSVSVKDSESLEYSDYVANYKVTKTATTTKGEYSFKIEVFDSTRYSLEEIDLDFSNGTNLVLVSGLESAETERLRNMQDDYGVLPYPKYDEEQKEYLSFSHDFYGAVVIPNTNTKPEIVGATLEAMASYAYRDTVTSSNLMIFSPNNVFGDYISEVLPRLGEENIKSTPFNEYASELFEGRYRFLPASEFLDFSVNGEGIRKKAARIKTSSRLADALKEHIDRLSGTSPDFPDLVYGGKCLMKGKEMDKLYTEDFSYLSIQARMNKLFARVSVFAKDPSGPSPLH